MTTAQDSQFIVHHKVNTTGFSRSALALRIQQEWNSRIAFLPAGVARLAWREQEDFSPLRQAALTHLL